MSSATYAGCAELQGFFHAAASGWALSSPDQMSMPLRGTGVCTVSSIAPHSAMCMTRVTDGKEAQEVASGWLHELKTCLQAKPDAGGTRSVPSLGGTRHAVMEFAPVEYQGLPFRMSLRITEDPKAPSVAWVIVPILGGTMAVKKPEDNLCPMLTGLLGNESRRQDWKDWTGPKMEEMEDGIQYVCAKVPTNAASRFDCDLRIGPEYNTWQARWAYPLSMTDSIYDVTESIAKNIAACDVGFDWKKGKTRHVLDHAKTRTRMSIVGNKNDIGRGPSVVLQIQYWK